MAPPSRTLSSSSSNILAFIAKLLLDYLGELRHLPGRQISRHILGVCIEQQDQVSSGRPVVNDAGASALTARTNRQANLSYPNCSFQSLDHPTVAAAFHQEHSNVLGLAETPDYNSFRPMIA
jgi:hypothetical protein